MFCALVEEVFVGLVVEVRETMFGAQGVDGAEIGLGVDGAGGVVR